MAIRFLNTNFYKSPFVRSLKAPLKTLYSFIICDCEGSGVWVKDLEVATIYIGYKVTEKEFEEAFIKTGKAIDLNDGKVFFPDFIEHQYPKGLQKNNPAHKNFILTLKKYELIDDNLKPLYSPFEGSISIGNGNGNSNCKGKGQSKSNSTPKKDFQPVLPFNSDQFSQAWNNWIEYRKEVKKPYKTKRGIQGVLKQLGEMGEERAIKAIYNSIAQEYQGIFEPKTSNQNHKQESKTERNLRFAKEMHDKIMNEDE